MTDTVDHVSEGFKHTIDVASAGIEIAFAVAINVPRLFFLNSALTPTGMARSPALTIAF